MPVKLRYAILNKLASHERPQYMYEYYVTGRGLFPFDMLRYDSCWPATADDAANIDSHYERGNNRSIKMRSYTQPTIERWQSFLWTCSAEKL